MGKFQQIKSFCEGAGCLVIQDEPMKNHTSFKIGGPAELFIRTESITASEILRMANTLQIPVTIIGKGSNLLVSDEGIEGVVLCLDEEKEEPVQEANNIIACPAGTSLMKLCAYACSLGLSGLEFAWGIPGSVGGAVYMNAGAYGGEVKDVLVSAEYLGPDGTLHKIKAEELGLSYRKSWFMDHPGCLITKAFFHLTPGNPAEIRKKMDSHMQARKEKQPLEYPSAGSTFKRPQGAYASQLIDQCGLKGCRIGGAMISEKHAGFLINYENAVCRDVCLLIQKVQEEVQKQTGILLECEVQRLGKMPDMK